MKKFLGITFVLLLGISLIGGCSNQDQQSNQSVNDEEQPMEQIISTGDIDLDNTLNGIDYDLNNLQYSNGDINTNY